LAAGGIPPLCVLVDPVDTTINSASNPVVTQAYFSGSFILSFLQVGGGLVLSNLPLLLNYLRLNDINVEGTTQIIPGTYPGTNYGQSIPRESAPV
jgi:hypothetical protein